MNRKNPEQKYKYGAALFGILALLLFVYRYNQPDRRWERLTLEAVHCQFEEQPQKALSPALKAWQIAQKNFEADSSKTSTSITLLASVYDDLKRYQEAEELYLEALKISEEIYGPDHLEVAICLSELGGLYRKLNRHEEARPLLERTLEIRRQKLGATHDLTKLAEISLQMLDLK